MPTRFFEPSFIWNRAPSSGRKGVLSRLLGELTLSESIEKIGLNCEDEEHDELKTLSIQDSNAKISFLFQWKHEQEKQLISGDEAAELLSLTLQRCNYRVGELFLDLKDLEPPKKLESLLEVSKIHLRLASVDSIQKWLKLIAPNGLEELNISPFGDEPVDVPKEVFELPHQVSSAPNAIKRRISGKNEFVVLEWFFSKRVEVEKVLKELVMPKGDRKERFSAQTQSFEPVEVYSMVQDDEKPKMSLMVAEDGATQKPYSLALYASS
ncbi:unnamed protein product [Caenorhabditis sp. 36 PRJEB53466]|nr:unnamed protein product [Caenorhabditis sp. 36 PRJEB53466]